MDIKSDDVYRRLLAAMIITFSLFNYSGLAAEEINSANAETQPEKNRQVILRKVGVRVANFKPEKKETKIISQNKTVKKLAVKKKTKKVSRQKKGVGNGQCVAYAKYASGLNYSGDAIKWKKYINSKTPQKGAVVVLSSGKYGHVAVVKEIKGDKIILTEQNIKGLYVISTRTISAKDPKILGYVTKKAKSI